MPLPTGSPEVSDDGTPPGRSFTDYRTIRKNNYNSVLEAAKQIRPVEYGNYRLRLSDFDYEGPEDYDLAAEKKAILEGGTLQRRLRGVVTLEDKQTGKPLSQRRMTLAGVPYYTPRGTFVFNGTEYGVAHQARLQPGIYTRTQENGQLESHINVLPGRGFSHRYHLEPETGVFKLAVGQSNIPLMPLLRAVGITDKEMQQAWGSELYRANLEKLDNRVIDKLYQKIMRDPDPKASPEEKQKAVAETFLKMEVDPEVTRYTLGKPYRQLSREAMLDTTRKLLAVARGEAEDDDRDHMANQRVVGPEDLLGESLNKAYTVLRPLLWKAARTGNLDGIAPGFLTKMVQSGLLESGLANPIEEVNVLDLLDTQTRISRMGRGSIGSIDAIPDSARAVHPSQLMYIDSVRTGECYAEDMEVMTRRGWVKWLEVTQSDEFACLIDNRLEFHRAERLQNYDYDGVMYGAESEFLSYLVTPNHRMWVCPYQSLKFQMRWRFETAEQVHNQRRRFLCGGFLPYLGEHRETFRLPEVADLRHSQGYGGTAKSFAPFAFDTFADFLGWYIAEGSIAIAPKRGYYRVDISQSWTVNHDKCLLIESVLQQMGCNYRRTKTGFYVCGKRLAIYLQQFGFSHEKWLPEEFLFAQESARTRLMKSLLNGDGSFERGKHTSLSTASSRLALDFQRLAFSLGYSTRVTWSRDSRYPDYGGDYTITLHDRTTRVFTENRPGKPYYFTQSYRGKVYCATVPGGLLHVRRGRGIGFWCGNSLKAGVDLRMARGARKGPDGTLYAQFKDARTGKTVWRSPRQVADLTIAFPGELSRDKPLVNALVKGRFEMVPREQVDVAIPHKEDTFNQLANLIPFKSATKGQRVAMGSRFLQQAVPLKEPQAALVASRIPGSDKTFDEEYGSFAGAVRARTGGRVLKIEPDAMTVQYDDGTKERHDLYNNHVLNRKTLIHNTPTVQPGQRVEPGQLLARSNYTDEQGRLALGANFRTAYIANSQNYEDAFVISESAAKRMTSEHAYQHTLDWEDTHKRGKRNFVSLFPTTYDRRTLDRMDDDGVIKPGTVVEPGQPLVLLGKQKELSHKQIHSAHKGTFSDQSLIWDHHEAGIVTDVAKTSKGVNVVVKSYAPMQVGDKMSGLYGDKGVVSSIIPDDQMPHDTQGRPFEVLANPLGIISRVNPGQIYAAVLGKIAEQRGKRYTVEDFDEAVDDLADYVDREAKQHQVQDTEVVIDPRTGKKIPDVLTGSRYYLKLHHMAAGKGSARGLGAYTAEQTPARGSGDAAQAKKVALMDVNSLLSHGALQVIKDNKLVRGNQNLEYWTTYMAGDRPSSPPIPFIYQKLIHYLKSAGINVQRQGSRTHLMALTDKQVQEMAGDRELKNIETVDWKDGMRPIPGGLFDPALTGGHQGGRFAKITLHEPLPNPVMEEPIRRVLGLTQKEFEDVLAGSKDIDGEKGPQAVAKALSRVNLDKAIEAARAVIKNGRKTHRDDAVKKLGFLVACKNQGIHPRDWMLSSVPVLPPLFRPVSVMQGSGGTLIADPNYLYKDLFEANAALKDLSAETDDLRDERLNVYNAFKAVVGLGDPVNPKHVEKRIGGLLATVFGNSPKTSIVQSKLIGTPVNTVARGVISPNPDLNMDEVGVPESFAWTIYAPFIVRRLVRQGVPRVQAMEYLEKRTQQARKALLESMDDGPVLLTRAPVLHRWGHMAFWPRLTKGDVIQVSPPVVTGMGADFDGDAQYDHVFCSIDRKILADFDDCARMPEDALLSEMSMPFASNESTVFSGGADTCLTHLESFPHGKLAEVSQGQFGRIEWYEVPDGIRTLSYNDREQIWQWRQVSRWSKHFDLPVQIVTLQSGRQIFTDDDPRAVYGVRGGTLEFGRWRPADAVKQKVIVPRLVRLHTYPETATHWQTGACGHTGQGIVPACELKVELPLDADVGYVLGVVIGDGWVQHFENVPRAVTVAGINQAVIEKVDRLLATWFVGQAPQRVSVTSRASMGPSQHHTWNSKQLASALIALVGRKAQNKRLPPWFLSAPDAFRRGLFAGLMDTDGSISVSRGKLRPQLMANFSSTSLRLCQEVILLAASIDVRGRITPSRTPAGEPYWMISWANMDIQRYGGEHMAHDEKLAKLQSMPLITHTPASVRHDMLPISRELAAACMKALPQMQSKDERLGVYCAFSSAKSSGMVARETVRRFLAFMRGDTATSHPDWPVFMKVFGDETVTWDAVASFEDTGVTHTGYDLTVPGTETFVSATGVVLSNTSNIHVPVSEEAKREAAAKMLPSRNLTAASDLKSVMFYPRQEYQGGLYALSTQHNKDRRPRVFATVKDLRRALESGEVDPGDPVEVLRE